MNAFSAAPDALEIQTASNHTNRVLAFEMEVEGHHPGYVLNFARTWAQYAIPGLLDFVVTPAFFERHPEEVAEVQALRDFGISIHRLTDAEYERMERISYLRYFHAWRYFCEYLERLNADHGLVMYYDFFQLPSVIGQACPKPYSVLYFRPTFHYHLLDTFRPTFKERIRAWRKKLLMRFVLRQPQLERLYCLDDLAVQYMSSEFETKTEIRNIADTFSVYESSPTRQAHYREKFGIDRKRRVFTLLGVLDKRKGIKELLECLPRISDEAGEKICILLSGVVRPSLLEPVRELIRSVQAETKLQVILNNDYLPDSDVQHVYDLSDVILATYQGHMGSSSALIRAALAGKPVLSADYGLMGEIVRDRRLGLLVDTGNPTAMASALEKLALESDLNAVFDPNEAERYAQENTPERLAADLAVMVEHSSSVPRSSLATTQSTGEAS